MMPFKSARGVSEIIVQESLVGLHPIRFSVETVALVVAKHCFSSEFIKIAILSI
jgi:hypothetical protein